MFAVIIFGARGSIQWAAALLMAAANIAGAWVGTHLVLRRGDRLVRAAILMVVSAATLRVSWDLAR